MSDYDALVKEWYRNANQMAALFANYNPYFESRETRNMLLNHLDLTLSLIHISQKVLELRLYPVFFCGSGL